MRKDVAHAITWSRVGLTFINWVHCIMLMAWPIACVIPNFSNGTIFHCPPLFFEILCLLWVSYAIQLGLVVRHNEFVSDTKMAVRKVNTGYVIIVIAIAFNVVHIIFTIIQLTTPNSTPGDLFWFLIVFTVILFIIVAIECSYLYFLWYYKLHLGMVDVKRK